MPTETMAEQIGNLTFKPQDCMWEATGGTIRLWGHELKCSVRFFTRTEPDEINLKLFMVAQNTCDQDTLNLIRECETLLPELKKHVLPPIIGLREKTMEHYDTQAFKSINTDLQAVFRQRDLTPIQHCRAAAGVMARSAAFFKELSLPEELLRDDSPLYMAIAMLNAQAHGLRDRIKQAGQADAADCLSTLNAYIEALEGFIDLADEHSAKLRGLPRPMSVEETLAAMSLEDKFGDEDTPIKRRMELCRELLALPLLSPEDKIAHIETILEALEEAEDQEDGAEKHNAGALACPAEFKPYLQLAADLLEGLEQDGLKLFTSTLSAQALDKAARGDTMGKALLTQEELEQLIIPYSIDIQLEEDTPRQVELEFCDTGGFLGPQHMSVRLEDNVVTRVNIPSFVLLPFAGAPKLPLGKEYVRKLKEASLAKGIKLFGITRGASPEELQKLKKAYPEAPDSLISILAEVDGTYYRDYGGTKVCLSVFGGVMPYYLNSVKQIIGGRRYENTGVADEPGDSIADLYGEEYLEELVGPGIDPYQPLSRMLHLSDCTNNGGTSQLYIDFNPAQGGVKGQIVCYVHDPDEYTVIAPSLDSFLLDNLAGNFEFLEEEEPVEPDPLYERLIRRLNNGDPEALRELQSNPERYYILSVASQAPTPDVLRVFLQELSRLYAIRDNTAPSGYKYVHQFNYLSRQFAEFQYVFMQNDDLKREVEEYALKVNDVSLIQRLGLEQG